MKSLKKELNWDKIEEELKGGYYGTVECHGRVGESDLLLYEINIADPDEDETGWECAEWYLVDDDGKNTLIARCDGYTGVGWEINDEELQSLLGYNDEDWEDEEEAQFRALVTSYQITGELIAAAKEATLEDAEEGDEEVSIWREVNYYAGTCAAPTDGFINYCDLEPCESQEQDLYDLCKDLYDDRDYSAAVMTYAQAAAIVNSLDSVTYTLSHGEAGRPNYRIVTAA